MESPGTTGPSNTLLVLQLKSLVAYKSNDEYLYAMKEDLAEWFMCLYQLDITVDNFFEILETGVILCEHANKVKGYADEQRQLGRLAVIQSNFVRRLEIPLYEVPYRKEVKPQTFHARDNISNFITWTKDLGIPDVLSFETDDLVLRKNEKSVVLCLLEIARIGAKLGMLAPTLVQMEEEIDAEIESGEPPPQIITCDIKSLDEMVKWLAGRCTCPVQFPIVKVGEGKYKIGDSQTLVFVRILRNHVMIRVGGGWDTLEHYLDKHDPCRCGFSGHRNTPIPQSQRTPTRRASTPNVSQTLPAKSSRKISVGPVSHSISESSERTNSPAPRMRSASPGPSPGKLNIQSVSQNYGTKPPVSPLSPTTGNVNSPGFSGQRTNTVLANSRRSQSPAPVSRLRSPSPVSGINKALQPREQTSKVPRPASPSKRCPSPSPSARSASPGPKRCTSPSFQRAVSMSPAPSRKNSQATLVSNYSRSKSIPNTPRPDRRQLPQRPSMDSEGNDSVGTDDTSGSNSMQPSVDINQISTMTLDEFKNLLNSALSVPNGNASEGSLESPRSQSSTDSSRNISSYGANRGGKKPPISEKPSRYKYTGNASRSLDTKSFKDQYASNGYFEMEKPKRTILASSTVSRPKTPVSNSVSRPKTPVSSSVQRPKTPVSSVQRPKTPVSSNTVQRPKTPVSSIQRPKTPVSSVPRPKTTPVSSVQPGSVQNVSRPKTPTSSYSMPRPTLNTTRTLQTNEINTVKPHTKLHESKSDSVLSERERPVQNVKPNVSYVCISSEEPKTVPSGEFKGTETYTLSNDSVDSSCDFNGTSSSSMTRSITDPGPEKAPQSTQEVPKSNTNDSLIASFNALQKSIQELRNRAQQACIAVENNKKTESKQNENSKMESTNMVVTSSSSQPTIETTTIKRPATPTGRPSTPSLIPRPMTPVGNVSKSLSLTQTIEPVQQETTRQERPPTPKKATILAKSPSANKVTANTPKKITSYTAIHAQRRSTTPGPNELSKIKKDDTGAEIPRSKTPGPGNRITNTGSQPKSYVSPIRRLTQNQQQTSTFTAREIPESDYNNPREQRSVSASPATPRRSSITGLKAKTPVKQDSSEETIMVTVNRDSGRHKINVKDGEETKYKTSKTNTGRIIARAQTPTNQRTSTESLDRSRSAKPATEPKYRPRPRSVDPENWNRGANKEEEVLRVKRKDSGSHVVLNRTEAWVESAAKTVSAGKTPSKNKIPAGILRRSKTPNPSDLDQYNMESRPLEEIKAALTLPVNGLRDIAADELEAPPEDPEMYEIMEKLFQKMRERELKASVNETPGGDLMGDIDVNCMENEDNLGSDEMSLDSNENIKRRGNSPASKPSSHQSPASSARGSVPSTPRSKTPSFSRSSSSSQPINRPVSTPPRPSTPTRSSVNSSRRSSMKSSNGSVPESPTTANVDHAVIIVSKIKEILKTNPRKDNKEGPRSRIPAPKSLSASGKSRSFSNLFNLSSAESSYQKENSPNHKYMNGNTNGEYYDDEMEEISGITARAEQNDLTENVRSQSGTKTPVPKLATPLTTGRTAVLNRETSTDKSNRLVRAVSISSLSSSSNTLSCTYGEEEEFV